MLFVACATPQRTTVVAEEPAFVDATLPSPARFAPASPAAIAYGGPSEPSQPSALADKVLEAMRPIAGSRRPMVVDAALSRACADLAQLMPTAHASELLVEYALQRQGLVEPLPKLLVVLGDPSDHAAIASQLRARLAPEMFYAPAIRVGIGIGAARDGIAPIAIAILGSRLALEPIPRAISGDGTFVFDATIDDKLTAPHLEVRRADGSTLRPALAETTPHRFAAEVACGPATGRIEVELSATHPSGPTTVASFPVWCGAAPPTEFRYEPAAIDQGDPAAQLVARVNRDRLAAGLPALRSDPESTRAARAHAAERVAAGARAVAPPDIAGAAYSTIQASELRLAYEALANAHASRATMMAPTSTHLGAGVARDANGGVFVTLVYRRVPPKIDRAQARRDIVRRLQAATKLEPYPDLGPIAEKMADQLVRGMSAIDAWRDMQWWIDDVRRRFAKFAYTVSIVPDLEGAQAGELLGPHRVHAYGVAVRQADHRTLGRNAIWIVVMTATRRE